MNLMKKTMMFCWILTMALAVGCFPDDSVPPKKLNGSTDTNAGEDVEILMTAVDESMLGVEMPSIAFDKYVSLNASNVIHIDDQTQYQEIDGFGAALTGSSAYLLRSMDTEERGRVLRELFDPEEGLGISALRLSIGACDYSLDFYTYCDTPPISNFAIHSTDRRDLLPILKEVLALNPDIRIFATTWSAPKWMRTGDRWTGDPGDSGLKDECIEDFAEYYLKYVQAMAEEGIDIYGICPQNEPLSSGNTMSMRMTAAQQITFIKSLGAKFKANGINTKIICFDHNWDLNQFVKDVYADPEAFEIVDGAAFHAYGGTLQGQIEIKSLYPTKNIYFTEQSGGGWAPGFGNNLKWWMSNLFIGAVNNWSKCVLLWNLMLDANHGPYLTPGAATNCYGLLEQAAEGGYTRYSEYYAVKQMRVIRTGARIIGTSGYTPSGLMRVAAKNPDGSKALVVYNETGADQSITVSDGTHLFSYTVPNETIASFHWK